MSSYITDWYDKTTGPAAGVYSASAPRFGNIAQTTGYITRNTVAGARCDGVIDGESKAVGDSINLQKTAEPLVEAGGAFVRGDLLASDNVGRAVLAAGTGTFPNGKAGQAATAAGQLVPITLGTYNALP